MAFDEVMNCNNPSVTGILIKGESKIIDGAIALTDEWSFSLENKLNITQHTSGAGAGKAEFEAFTIKKQIDTASANLLVACGSGAHFQGVTVKIFKSGGNFSNAKENLYICWTFNQLAVEKGEWSYADPPPGENVTFKFASCTMPSGQQPARGKITPAGLGSWNQISTCGALTTGIAGALQPIMVTG